MCYCYVVLVDISFTISFVITLVYQLHNVILIILLLVFSLPCLRPIRITQGLIKVQNTSRPPFSLSPFSFPFPSIVLPFLRYTLPSLRIPSRPLPSLPPSLPLEV